MARAGHIPQQLWPGWTIRLLPASRLRADRFRAVIAACMLLPGHPMRNLNQVTAHLHPYLRRRVATTLRDLQADGHQQVLAAVCQLADYLDRHGTTIDYHRRRATIGPATAARPTGSSCATAPAPTQARPAGTWTPSATCSSC